MISKVKVLKNEDLVEGPPKNKSWIAKGCEIREKTRGVSKSRGGGTGKLLVGH